MTALVRPAHVCRALLAALEASEGRRKKRKRDQTPDAIGLAAKHELLQRVVDADPDPERLEEWLLGHAERARGTAEAGTVAAMARNILDEWRLASSMREFAAWLEQGAPSADADTAQRS